jgi:D-alanine-D-alanine ligase
MRIAVLHEALPKGARPDEEDVRAQVALVSDSLTESGHEVDVISVSLDLEALARSLRALRPDLVFNLVESLGGSAGLIHVVPALLRAGGIRFTGSSPEALLLTSHKVVAKRWLSSAGIPTPAWVERGAVPDRERARWILKPVLEDASVGIDDASVVECDGRELARLLDERRAHPAGDFFAERYVEGREWNLSLLAKPEGLELLPPAEILFEGFPAGKPRIVGYAAKWEPGSFEWNHTPRSFDASVRDRKLLAGLSALAHRSASVLGVQGYARVDFRVDPDGEPFVLEVNANPCLSPDAGFLAAAQRRNLGPREVVCRIVDAALASGPHSS